MTPRERILAAMRRESPDAVPCELYLTPTLQGVFREKTGQSDPAEYWEFEERIVSFARTSAGADYTRYYTEGIPAGSTIGDWGVLQRPSGFHHFTGLVHPLRTANSLNQIVDYPLPQYQDPSHWRHLSAEVDTLHGRGFAAHGTMGQTLFETAWLIRSMEELLPDMLTGSEKATVLLDRLTEIRRFQARTFAAADVDIIRLGDDVATQRGMMISPQIWREWLKPRMAEIIRSAREAKPDVLIWYHSDGDCRAIVPELIEIGVDILNPVQPECMDPAAMKRLYGDRLSFSGTIGTQTTMPFGSPQEVREAVRLRIETVGGGGGLLLAPTHVLEPDVPWENILAFVVAARELGPYG